nr:hypothetical protein [Vibrio cincinnatiensis]
MKSIKKTNSGIRAVAEGAMILWVEEFGDMQMTTLIFWKNEEVQTNRSLASCQFVAV